MGATEGPAAGAARGNEDGEGFESDLLATARQMVLALGRRADAALAVRGSDRDRRAVRSNLARVAEDLAGRVGDRFPQSVARGLAEASGRPGLHLSKILPRIAGASLVTARFGRMMTPSNRSRAYVAKALFECEQDLIDDVLDSGTYTFLEARRLYDVCGENLTDNSFDPADHERRLATILSPDHRPLAPLLSRIGFELKLRLRTAPCRDAVMHELISASERLGIAQSATVLLREPSVDFATARRTAENLWSPDPEAPWFDRLAAHASWVLCHTLIDLCFLEEPMTDRDLAAHRAVWYDLNVHMSLFDHVAGLEKDLADGIYNFAWAAIHAARGTMSTGPAAVTRVERVQVVLRAAAAAARAIRRDEAHTGGGDDFYLFLAMLVPVVLTARGVGNESWALDTFLEAFAASYHSATYSQQASPRRTHRGFDTRPWNPRDFRMPS